ncbi:hypothetical protein GEV33_012721 [Tenebrio molitor]|uniref:Uncharacterized protein n=1 Tax=Tenebrio molitor TaxID=7067 RepID=A0A8J6H1L0_TENMO|nr:hypothetical protein GEV33_012721 [Tenebrio molitor]
MRGTDTESIALPMQDTRLKASLHQLRGRDACEAYKRLPPRDPLRSNRHPRSVLTFGVLTSTVLDVKPCGNFPGSRRRRRIRCLDFFICGISLFGIIDWGEWARRSTYLLNGFVATLCIFNRRYFVRVEPPTTPAPTSCAVLKDSWFVLKKCGIQLLLRNDIPGTVSEQDGFLPRLGIPPYRDKPQIHAEVLGRGAAGADHLEYHEQEGQVSPARHEPGHSCHPVVFRGPLFDICLPEPPLFMPVIDTFNSGRRLLSPDEYPSNSFALRALQVFMRWLNSVCDRFRPRRWYLPGFCNRDDLQGSSFINASKETYWFSGARQQLGRNKSLLLDKRCRCDKVQRPWGARFDKNPARALQEPLQSSMTLHIRRGPLLEVINTSVHSSRGPFYGWLVPINGPPSALSPKLKPRRPLQTVFDPEELSLASRNLKTFPTSIHYDELANKPTINILPRVMSHPMGQSNKTTPYTSTTSSVDGKLAPPTVAVKIRDTNHNNPCRGQRRRDSSEGIDSKRKNREFRFVGVDLSKNFLGRFGSHLVHKYLRHNLAESVGKESLRAALFSLGLPVNAPLYGRLGVDSASSDVVSSLTTCPIFHHHPACQRSHHR